VIVGFGIDSGAKARAASLHADGIAVGTALVNAIDAAKTPEARRKAATDLVHDLRAGLDASS
jgi:tryptophan synthase alpha chain